MYSQARADRLLSWFAPVRPGEGPTALLLTANLFLLMAAYYIVKPVRDSLILSSADAEIKAYAGAAGALALLVLVPLYGKVADRLDRIRLINGVTAFFASNLVIFCVWGRLNASFGIVFYLWVGLFNLMVVAQFWAFTSDVYTEEQGKRLFAVIGIGSSFGAICGSGIAGRLFMLIGPFSMMLVAAGLLVVCIVLTNRVRRRETNFDPSFHKDLPTKRDGGFQLVLKHRYLTMIALLVGSSRVDLQACKLEYSIVSPK